MDTPIIFLILLLIYTGTLFLLKNIGYNEKIASDQCANCCPDCTSPLERVRRNQGDHFFNFVTFHMFGFKRYKCNTCEWKGLRWEKKFTKK